MATNLANSWTPFREFFNRADMYGINLTAAAETLLAELANKQDDHFARGLKRTFDYVSPSEGEVRASMDHQEEWNALAEKFDALSGALATDPVEAYSLGNRDQIERELALTKRSLDSLQPIVKPFEGWREHLPRETQSLLVPKAFWAVFSKIDADCTSNWVDDPDDAVLWAEANWISGSAARTIYGEDIHRQELRFELLDMQSALARLILGRLQVGPPSVPRSIVDEMLKNFILHHSGTGGYDAAHREWSVHPSFDGTTQPAFRMLWKATRGPRGPGAPRKK